MSAPAYMNWYPGDYLKDTRALTLEQHGAYHLLLWECWAREGFLPDNDPALARVVGVTPAKWAKLRPEVMAFFVWTPEGWRHRRVSAELAKALAAREKRSAAGSKGGHAKASNATAMLQQCSGNALASSASASAEEPSQEGVRSHSVVVGIDRARRGFE